MQSLNDFEASQLKYIHSEISVCTNCSLSTTRRCAVPGTLVKNYKFFIIGETPGADEDETGEPFIGYVGQFLREEFHYAGINIADGFLTNAIKCRPAINGYNRPPTDIEFNSCKPWLAQQLKLLAPKLVITTGKFSLAYMLNANVASIKVRDFVGKPLVLATTTVFPLFHPAYIARCKQSDEDDYYRFKVALHRLSNLIKSINTATAAITVIEQVELLEQMRQSNDPNEVARIRGILQGH